MMLVKLIDFVIVPILNRLGYRITGLVHRSRYLISDLLFLAAVAMPIMGFFIPVEGGEAGEAFWFCMIAGGVFYLCSEISYPTKEAREQIRKIAF
jgi:hypothetical protein